VTSPLYSEAVLGHQDGVGETASLQARSALWSETAQSASATPISVEQQLQLNPNNGRSQIDAQRVLPGNSGTVFPTANGASEQANQGIQKMLLAGDRKFPNSPS
jgi:hypothetical protein